MPCSTSLDLELRFCHLKPWNPHGRPYQGSNEDYSQYLIRNFALNILCEIYFNTKKMEVTAFQISETQIA